MTRLGTSDLDVLPLALGANTFGWTSDEAASHAVLDAFTAAGGTLVDTADVYSAWAPGNSGGESETVIGRWLARTGRRADLVVATKVSQHPDFAGLSAENVAAAADASLRRLGTDHVDLYYAHVDDADTPIAETVAAFARLQQAGKVRHVGISNYTADRVQEWAAAATDQGVPLPVALQPHYNLLHRKGFETDLAPVAAQWGMGVLPYFALASGFLSGKYRTREDLEGAARGAMAGQYVSDGAFATLSVLDEVAADRGVAPATVALAWLRRQPTVVAPIASARTPDQLQALLASTTTDLTDEELGRLDAVSAGLG